MNSIVFPETVGSLPRSRRPLMLSHVLAIFYCFGGVTGVLYILSKFVVNPLFEQLTFDRRLLAEETRERLTQLNALISHAVSRTPAFKVSRSDYVEQVVQADCLTYPESSKPVIPTDASIKEKADHYVSSFRELQQLVKSLDPNDERQMAQAGVANQANEIIKQMRAIQYEAVPSTLFALGVSPSNEGKNDGKNDGSTSLADAVVNCKQEIRALKSSILSG